MKNWSALDIGRLVVGAVATALFAFVVVWEVAVKPDPAIQNVVIGALVTVFTGSIVVFFFGTTSSSSKKDDTIAQLAAAAPAAPQTPTPRPNNVG